MKRSVTLSTPIPTLEEFGKSLGLSKTRQNRLLRLTRGEGGVEGLDMRHRDASGTIRKSRSQGSASTKANLSLAYRSKK